MKKNLTFYILGLLQRLFIRKNTLPPFLIFSSLSLEFLLYSFAIHQSEILILIFPKINQSVIPLLAIQIVLLLYRLLVGVSFIKNVYPAFLCLTLKILEPTTIGFSTAVLVLMSVLILVDILSNINFSFQVNSLEAETINFCKILHYILFLFGIIQGAIWNNLYSHLACALGFGILTLLQISS